MIGMANLLIKAEKVRKAYSLTRGLTEYRIQALQGVDFFLPSGIVAAVAGESGSGKTTLAKILVSLVKPDYGRVFYAFAAAKGRRSVFRPGRLHSNVSNIHKDVQMVFQNPFTSLNPKMKIWEMLYEPLYYQLGVPKKNIRQRIEKLLDMVSLNRDVLEKYPYQLSGGQAQRAAIARSLAVEPKVLICDEPVSNLDVITAKEVIETVRGLKNRFLESIVLISHNIAMLAKYSDYIYVMYKGRVVEEGRTSEVINFPRHSYTEKLINSAMRV